MKYADVDGQRVEASPKARGICRACGQTVIAKCGRFVLWHWAHRSLNACDRWAEPETPWHRAWKNQFPEAWQEVAVFDAELTDCHIADVKTEMGLVLEFQRSTIHPDQVEARERFHQRMVWVIDGLRNEFDPIYFRLMITESIARDAVKFHWSARSRLFHRWHTTTPVFIDFGDNGFWRILRFDIKNGEGVAQLIPRADFVARVRSGATDFATGGGPASPGLAEVVAVDHQ